MQINPRLNGDLDKIFGFATEFREKVACYWDDGTRHPSMKPVPEGRPNSYGQCWQSSIALLGELEKNFPKESFQLVRGVVLKLDNTELHKVIDYHAWLNWELPGYNACAIDVTGDQAGSNILPPVIVKPYTTLADSGIVYLTTGLYGNLQNATRKLAQKKLGKRLLRQAAMLEQRYYDVSPIYTLQPVTLL